MRGNCLSFRSPNDLWSSRSLKACARNLEKSFLIAQVTGAALSLEQVIDDAIESCKAWSDQ